MAELGENVKGVLIQEELLKFWERMLTVSLWIRSLSD